MLQCKRGDDLIQDIRNDHTQNHLSMTGTDILIHCPPPFQQKNNYSPSLIQQPRPSKSHKSSRFIFDVFDLISRSFSFSASRASEKVCFRLIAAAATAFFYGSKKYVKEIWF